MVELHYSFLCFSSIFIQLPPGTPFLKQLSRILHWQSSKLLRTFLYHLAFLTTCSPIALPKSLSNCAVQILVILLVNSIIVVLSKNLSFLYIAVYCLLQQQTVLFLGADVLATCSQPINHHVRIHSRYAKLGLATKVTMTGVFIALLQPFYCISIFVITVLYIVEDVLLFSGYVVRAPVHADYLLCCEDWWNISMGFFKTVVKNLDLHIFFLHYF